MIQPKVNREAATSERWAANLFHATPLRSAQLANVVATGGAFGGIELSAQPDLPGGAGHVASTAIEGNQRCEPALTRRKIDTSGIGAK